MKAILMCVVVAAMAACSVPAKAPKAEAPDAGAAAPKEKCDLGGRCGEHGVWCGIWSCAQAGVMPAGCAPSAKCVPQQKPAPAAGK